MSDDMRTAPEESKPAEAIDALKSPHPLARFRNRAWLVMFSGVSIQEKDGPPQNSGSVKRG